MSVPLTSVASLLNLTFIFFRLTSFFAYLLLAEWLLNFVPWNWVNYVDFNLILGCQLSFLNSTTTSEKMVITLWYLISTISLGARLLMLPSSSRAVDIATWKLFVLKFFQFLSGCSHPSSFSDFWSLLHDHRCLLAISPKPHLSSICPQQFLIARAIGRGLLLFWSDFDFYFCLFFYFFFFFLGGPFYIMMNFTFHFTSSFFST